MHTQQREPGNASLALFASGIPCLIVSLIVLSQRKAVAAIFFGAHFLLGMPLTGDDSLKVLFVGFASMIGIAMGVILIAAAAMVLGKATRAQASPRAATTIPTDR